MPIIFFNITWMSFNIVLAILAVLFSYLFFKVHNPIFKIAFSILWLLFLPNTIYLFTDLLHVFFQWNLVGGVERMVLALQYGVLQLVGFVTFILAFKPFEYLLKTRKLKGPKKIWAIVLFNFLIAFGIVLGRVERINSWDVFVSNDKLFQAAIHILSSIELLGLTVLFGLFCNFCYFLLRDPIIKSTIKLKSSLAK